MLEAGVRQFHEWGNGDQGRHILIAVARYLAAHFPTERALLQTADIAPADARRRASSRGAGGRMSHWRLDALGLADAKARQFAVADAALDQLLAVWRIGRLVIGCVECRLVVVEEYRRPFFGHRTTAICAGRRDRPRPKREGEMKLYTYYRSQASFRVRIALNLKGIAREDSFLHLEKGDQFADAYRAINPQMVVPTLIDGDVKLFQSLAILEYLDEAYPEPPLLPADPLARAWVRGLALINVADSHPLIVPRVRHYLSDVLKVSDDQRLAWIQHWLGAGLQAIETLLAEHPVERPVLPWRESHGRGHLPRHPSDAGHDLQPLARPLSACHARL